MLAAAAIGAAGVMTANGSAPASATTTSGTRYQETYENAGTIGGSGTECIMQPLSATTSDGSPAYVSGLASNSTRWACTTWLQSSVNGGAWTDLSPRQTLPGGQTIDTAAWYRTADYYAGPGTRIRACYQAQVSATVVYSGCGSALTLTGSSTPPDDATTASVYYADKQHAASIPGTDCVAYLSSTTKSKDSGSQVAMVLTASNAGSCSGWLESSADNGATWEQSTPTYTAALRLYEDAFPPAVADGTGQLVRACAQSGTTVKCTPAW